MKNKLCKLLLNANRERRIRTQQAKRVMFRDNVEIRCNIMQAIKERCGIDELVNN